MDSKKTSEKLARQLNSVRRKKIDSLKARIIAGRYQVETQAIVKALILSQ